MDIKEVNTRLFVVWATFGSGGFGCCRESAARGGRRKDTRWERKQILCTNHCSAESLKVLMERLAGLNAVLMLASFYMWASQQPRLFFASWLANVGCEWTRHDCSLVGGKEDDANRRHRAVIHCEDTPVLSSSVDRNITYGPCRTWQLKQQKQLLIYCIDLAQLSRHSPFHHCHWSRNWSN